MDESDLQSGTRRARSAIRHVVIVLFSILLAFTTDAWWDAQGTGLHLALRKSMLAAEKKSKSVRRTPCRVRARGYSEPHFPEAVANRS